ncbi:MAG: GspH/FimT family pseudopilin [Burkholderiaceae bacterium]|nr:GspH/FimT family pseudopilin [Burkholderiaceae bacterium]
MQTRSFPTAQRGLSLIEGCVTLAIVGILAGTAAPSLDGLLKSRHRDGTAAELGVDLHHARTEAIARNEGVRISFHGAAAGTCAVIHTGAAADCTCDGNGTPWCLNGATALKATLYSSSRGASVYANVASMRFDPGNGTVTPAATVRVAGADGRAIHHIVNIMGRVRSCSSGGAIAGVRPC